MEKVALGTRVNRLGIPRVSVAEGSKCRVVLLDENPRMKHVAYDETIRRSVEVDQDMCIRYGLRPSPTFYYLVAKLNTDLQGRVIGDRFTVEYLQLSETQNNEFADAIDEQGIPNSLMLTKLKKTDQNGRDLSTIKVTLSKQDPLAEDANLAAKVNAVRNNTELIENSWKLIDAVTTITKDNYLKLKGISEASTEGMKQPEAIQANDSAPKSLPGNDFAQVNDFDPTGGNEFNEGFDK